MRVPLDMGNKSTHSKCKNSTRKPHERCPSPSHALNSKGSSSAQVSKTTSDAGDEGLSSQPAMPPHVSTSNAVPNNQSPAHNGLRKSPGSNNINMISTETSINHALNVTGKVEILLVETDPVKHQNVNGVQTVFSSPSSAEATVSFVRRSQSLSLTRPLPLSIAPQPQHSTPTHYISPSCSVQLPPATIITQLTHSPSQVARSFSDQATRSPVRPAPPPPPPRQHFQTSPSKDLVSTSVSSAVNPPATSLPTADHTTVSKSTTINPRPIEMITTTEPGLSASRTNRSAQNVTDFINNNSTSVRIPVIEIMNNSNNNSLNLNTSFLSVTTHDNINNNISINNVVSISNSTPIRHNSFSQPQRRIHREQLNLPLNSSHNQSFSLQPNSHCNHILPFKHTGSLAGHHSNTLQSMHLNKRLFNLSHNPMGNPYHSLNDQQSTQSLQRLTHVRSQSCVGVVSAGKNSMISSSPPSASVNTPASTSSIGASVQPYSPPSKTCITNRQQLTNVVHCERYGTRHCVKLLGIVYIYKLHDSLLLYLMASQNNFKQRLCCYVVIDGIYVTVLYIINYTHPIFLRVEFDFVLIKLFFFSGT